MNPFLDRHKDFVLKLKIQTADQTQIRRVSLPRIADASGDIAYEELVGLVLVFSLPEEDASRVNTSNYTVSLTYYDDEKDLITLASTEELKEAIELFAGQGFVRITTSVKPKTTYLAPPPPYSAATATNVARSSKDPPIKAVLESFAGILSTAVNNLQEGLANQSPASASRDDSQLKPPPPPAARMPKEKEPKAARQAARQNKRAEVRTKRRENKSGPTSTGSAPAGPTARVSPKEKEAEKKQQRESKPFTHRRHTPFIHGRHTCDGCLKTPIIGKRYHATNIPDYDLCQRCFDNYKGSEIKYEPVELRHDIALQSRWRARQDANERMAAMLRRQAARAETNRPSLSPRIRPASPPKNPSVGEANQNTNSASQDNASNPNDFDYALKEAIRRSLDDATKKAKEDEKTSEAEKMRAQEIKNCGQPAVEFEEVVEKNIEKVAQGIAEADKNIREVEKNITEEFKNIEERAAAFEKSLNKNIENMTKSIPDEESAPGKKEVPVEDAVPSEEMSEAKNDIPHSVDVIKNNAPDVECLGSSDAISEKASASIEVEDEDTMQNAMDTDSVDSEKLVSEPGEGEVLQTPTDVVFASPSSKQKGLDTSKNESFASDAVGNGDVAEVMGRTLDMVAGVISEMLEDSGEMVGAAAEIQEESSTMVQGSNDTEKPSENDEVVDSGSKPGELIVHSDDDASEADEEQDDADWSVVKSIGSNGTTESRKIGRAAEMIGSALFNSDMKSSAEGLGSNSMRSDSSFSIPSSVPTELGTVNSRAPAPTPASKWASELQKLKELGFDDEECCIGALERVKADSRNNDINMEYVVNQLLFLNS